MKNRAGATKCGQRSPKDVVSRAATMLAVINTNPRRTARRRIRPNPAATAKAAYASNSYLMVQSGEFATPGLVPTSKTWWSSARLNSNGTLSG
jgi:hypothetical protein